MPGTERWDGLGASKEVLCDDDDVDQDQDEDVEDDYL